MASIKSTWTQQTFSFIVPGSKAVTRIVLNYLRDDGFALFVLFVLDRRGTDRPDVVKARVQLFAEDNVSEI